MAATASAQGNSLSQDLRHIPYSFDRQDIEASCTRLAEWKSEDGNLKIDQMTDGITNIIIKVTPQPPGQSEREAEKAAVLIRVYGRDTEFMIDRKKELRAHDLLANMGLAAPLLATFDNGFMCGFIPGDICQPEDFHNPETYQQIAKTLGQWHGSLPISVLTTESDAGAPEQHATSSDPTKHAQPILDIWTNAQKWIDLLPANTDELKARNETFRKELGWLSGLLSDSPNPTGRDSYVFSHTDLLCANVILERVDANDKKQEGPRPVTFIDYEYATAAPAAFDVANFFAEWAGPDGELAWMPGRAQRLDFIEHYVASFRQHSGSGSSDDHTHGIDIKAAVDQMYDQVELFRGLPGFYWGVWGLIQASISDIDFDYVAYAERRHSEYWGWKAEYDGSREREGKEMTVREQAWAKQ